MNYSCCVDLKISGFDGRQKRVMKEEMILEMMESINCNSSKAVAQKKNIYNNIKTKIISKLISAYKVELAKLSFLIVTTVFHQCTVIRIYQFLLHKAEKSRTRMLTQKSNEQ